MGTLHPALGREGHMLSLVFAGLRASGYLTFAQASYYTPRSNSRFIDLAVWLPDASRWLYLELKPCGAQGGFGNVLLDARKLKDDNPRDPYDQLRGVLAYGFRTESTHQDGFKNKYVDLSKELKLSGFEEIQIQRRELEGNEYHYVQTGLWCLGLAAQ